jgi:hypothetical protein
MAGELVVRDSSAQMAVVTPQIDLMTLGGVLAKSGYFTDAREEAQAVVKVLAGQEMGIGAIAAMTGIYIVKNKVQVGANILAGLVKRSVRYDYRVKQLDDTACVLAFFERNHDGKFEPIGESNFSLDDAKKAEVGNLGKFPRNMLFARAMSNGVKWFCADVTGGATVYTPGELPAETPCDVMTGEVIEATPPSEAASTVVDAQKARKPKDDWESANAALASAFGKSFNDRWLVHWIASEVLHMQVDSLRDLTPAHLHAFRESFKQAPVETRKRWRAEADGARPSDAPTDEPQDAAAAFDADMAALPDA